MSKQTYAILYKAGTPTLLEALARIEQLEAALREIRDQYLTPDQSSAIAKKALTSNENTQADVDASTAAHHRNAADYNADDSNHGYGSNPDGIQMSSPPKREENSDVGPGFRGNNDYA